MVHLLGQDLHNCLLLVLRRLDEKLIVYLQDQPGAEVLSSQSLIHPDHGDLDDIGSGSLDRGVHRHALAEGTLHKVRGF